jgi:hypothetical protein
MGEPTMGEMSRWAFYQRFIAEHVTDTDPRHIEAWMRVAHQMLDGLSRSEFLAAMYEALGQVQDAGPTSWRPWRPRSACRPGRRPPS